MKKKKFVRKLKTAVSWLTGWKVIKPGLKTAWDLYTQVWRRITYRPTPQYPNDTFRAACRRHGIDTPGGDRTLDEVKAQIKAHKRLNQALALLTFFFLGQSIYHLNFWMFIMASLATTYSMLHVFSYSFRLWQCEIEKLSGVDEFFANNGLGRMFGV